MTYNKTSSGFSIMEMAVVLVVIAFIIIGITSGKTLIEAGKTRAVITKVEEYQSAIESFNAKYRDIPGDMLDATAYGLGAPNGDGDEEVEQPVESFMAWQHLEAADMISEGGLTGTSYPARGGSNVPNFTLPGATARIECCAPFDTNYIGIGGETTTVNDAVILPPAIAKSIDKKIDDGKPSTGRAIGEGTLCIKAGNAYDEEIVGNECSMKFQFNTVL